MLYLLYGKDIYRRDERLHEIRAAYRKAHPNALAETIIDGEAADAPQKIREALAGSGGLFEDKSLIVARHLLKTHADEAKTLLQEQGASGREDVHVLLLEDAKPKQSRGMQVEHFDALTESERVAWAARYVRDRGPKRGPRKITKRAATFVAGISPNLFRLSNELEKALAFAAGEEAITQEHIAAILDVPVEETIFPVSDGVCGREPISALSALTRLTAEGQDVDGLISYVLNESRQLIRAHAALIGGEPDGAQELFGVKPFVWRKRTTQARKWETEEIPALASRMTKLELSWKGGANKRLALEEFILAAGRFS